MDLKLILNSSKNKKSVNTDYYENIEFTQNSREIPTSNFSKIVNQYQIFDDERNSCTKYRLTASINTIATNVLINPITQIYSGSTEITGQTRLDSISIINTGYTYNCGYDIFDNHNLRVNSFKTGNTLNDFTGTTLSDVSTIQDAINNNLFEDNGWFYFINNGKLNGNRMFKNKLPCEKLDMFPTRDYFGFTPIVFNNKSELNWDYTLTYPYKNETNHNLVTDSNLINGMPISIGFTGSTNENGNYLQISTPYKHGLATNDIISFKYHGLIKNKTYQIYSVGDINGLDQEHTFILDIDKYSNLKNIGFIDDILNKRIVKVINGIESNYYLRTFRKIPNFKFESEEVTIGNIESKITGNTTEIASDNYQLAFSKNIFGDKIQQIQYIDDIDINLLTDNLGRPISEIYLTSIKRNIDSDKYGHNNIFGEVISGIDENPGVSGYTNVRILNSNNLTENAIENNITITGSTYGNNIFFGDIVEYNKGLVKETILDDVQHRFNTIQRELTGNTFEYTEFVSRINENLLLSTNDSYNMFTTIGSWLTTNGHLVITNSYYDAARSNVIAVESEEEYTLSFICTVEKPSFYHIEIENASTGAAFINMPPINGINKIIFIIPSGVTSMKVNFYGSSMSSGLIDLCNIKLEKDNIQTVWTPSPLDNSPIVI